jgi:hypothetical protein
MYLRHVIDHDEYSTAQQIREDEEEAANPGSNLFVTGIHPRLTEEEVRRLFEKYGDVETCSIMRDPHTRESRGFGFVNMVTGEQADAAKSGLQGEVYEGRTLSIEKARRSRPRTPTPGKYFGPPKRGQSPRSYHTISRLTFYKTMDAVLPVVAAWVVVTATTTAADLADVMTMADLVDVTAATTATEVVSATEAATTTVTKTVAHTAVVTVTIIPVALAATVAAVTMVVVEAVAMTTDVEDTATTVAVPVLKPLLAMLTPQLLLPMLLLLAAVVLTVRSAVVTDTNAVESATNEQGEFPQKKALIDMTAPSGLLPNHHHVPLHLSRHLLAALPRT